jgi:hypothetical protein
MSLLRATPTEQRQAKLQREHQERLRRLAEQKQSLKRRKCNAKTQTTATNA